MEDTDVLMNADSPVVQESSLPEHVELVLPEKQETVVMHYSEFTRVFGHGMRIVTGESVPD